MIPIYKRFSLIGLCLLISLNALGVIPKASKSNEIEINKSTALSLSDSVSLAVRNNPALQVSEEKINQADITISSNKTVISPTLSAQLTGASNKAAVNTASNTTNPLFDGTPYNSYGAKLKLTQSLFQVGTLRAVAFAEKSKNIAEIDRDITQRNLIESVINSYYKIILNAKNLQSLKDQIKIVNESLSVAQRRESVGRGRYLDVLQLKTQVALLKGKITTKENQFQSSASDLSALLGSSGGFIFKLNEGLEAPTLTEIDAALNLQNYSIPELNKNEVSYKQFDDQRYILLGTHFPSLSLQGEYGYSGFKKSDIGDSSALSWSVGLQLTVPLFSGFSSYFQRRTIASQQTQLVLDRKNIEVQITNQQIVSRKNLETALSAIQTGNEALKLAQASLKEARKNYNLFTIDFIQFLNAEENLVQAEQDLHDSKYNYIAALVQYFHSYGQDLRQLVKMLENTNKAEI